MSLTQTNTELFFRGRPGDPRLGEFTKPVTLPVASKTSYDRNTLVIIGSPDDNGVVLNRGRAGAAGGPDAIRSAFYKIAWPMDTNFERKITLLDAGNVAVTKDIMATHKNSFAASAFASSLGATVIALGGGHDFAAPHFLGWANGINKLKTKAVFGLINVDPHLDVRELENDRPHSGTPFRQILESKVLSGKNFIEFGARDGRNARSHFDYCKRHKVKIRHLEELKSAPNLISKFAADLTTLAKVTTHIGLTIDMDSCSELEGVSAAPVLGFSAWELCQMAWHAGKNKKVGFLELAEVAPSLDPTGRAARIAAEILFSFIRGRLSSI